MPINSILLISVNSIKTGKMIHGSSNELMSCNTLMLSRWISRRYDKLYWFQFISSAIQYGIRSKYNLKHFFLSILAKYSLRTSWKWSFLLQNSLRLHCVYILIYKHNLSFTSVKLKKHSENTFQTAQVVRMSVKDIRFSVVWNWLFRFS